MKSATLFCSVLFLLISSFNLHSQSSIEASFPFTTLCPGDCVDLSPEITAGVPPFTYLWYTGETDSTIVICPIEAQTRYDLTITDSTGDSLAIYQYAVVAPTSTKPIPTVTSPICIGETAYFKHNNVGWQPTYNWSGSNGFTTTDREFVLENITESQAGIYSLYLDYFEGCYTDTVELELVISDIEQSSTCEALSTCNFACGVFDFFKLKGATNVDITTDLTSNSVCGNNGEDINAVWLGFVAQNGDHSIIVSATACESGDGLRYGLYDDCSLENLILCSESCNMDDFIISSSILTPGQEYYLYVDGCGNNVCSYKVSIDGTINSSLCNDYVTLSDITEWQINSGGFGGFYSSWKFYTGDSIINGTTYRKIASEGNNLITLIRENKAERKVYIRKNGFDALLYDFSLSVGDSYYDPSFNNHWFVDRIELVQSNIGPLRRFWFKSNNFGLSWFYDEGVGAVIIDFPAHVVISDPVYGRGQVYAGCTQVFGSEGGYNKIRSSIDSIDISICDGDTLNGYSSPGLYADTLSVDGGCLELQVINLTITPNDTSNMGVTVCQGMEVDIEDAMVNSDGVYYSILEDSLVCGILIYEIDTIGLQLLTLDTSICVGDSLVLEGYETVYYDEGVYSLFSYDTITNCLVTETTLTLDIIELGEEDCVVSTKESDLDVLVLYPNPGNTYTTLYHENEPNGSINIYNSINRIVLNLKSGIKNTRIDISNLPNGIYTVVYNAKDYSQIARLVICHN